MGGTAIAKTFLVLHLAGQCPWVPWVVEQARQAAAETGATVEVADVATQPQLAHSHGLFFPFMTVIDGQVRVPAPTPATALIRRADAAGRMPAGSSPALPDIVPPAVGDEPARVIPLTAVNIADGCALCGSPGSSGCQLKAAWAGSAAMSLPDHGLGFIAYVGDRPVAAVEVLPAMAVPYPLPDAGDGDAFITCLYPTQAPDYRGLVLGRLLAELRRSGCRRALVVAGRRTPFPNGPLPFLAEHGFREVCGLATEQLTDGTEELVLAEYRF